MSKFWQKKYTSKYTGAEIDAAVAKAGDATKVTANPTLAGTEAALEGLQVGNTKYKVGGNESVLVLAFASETALNKSYAEVLAAIQNGVPLLLLDPESNTFMNCVMNVPATNVLHLQFSQTGYNSVNSAGQMIIYSIDYNSDDTFTLVPAMYSFTVTAMS